MSRRARLSHVSGRALLALLGGVLGVVALPGAGAASTVGPATKVVRYRGARVVVPASWPVFHLGVGSTVCVRFNRHAVYLGTPGTQQACPLDAAGRTEAILIAPEGSGGNGGSPAPVSVLGAAPAGGSMVRVRRADHLVITATWNRDPGTIRLALGMRSTHALRAAMLATNGHRPTPAKITPSSAMHGSVTPTAVSGVFRRGPRRGGRVVSPTSPATPGEVFTGLGFDTCTTPAQTSMSAWAGTSPYGAVGVYIGGTNAACPWGNLSAQWVSTQSAAGWHIVPIYVGLQAPGNSCGCAAISPAQAAAQGTAAALDAVAQAQALGIGTGNPIYFDMENYTRNATATTTVLAFLQAWTAQLHTSGYVSGVYASGSSGITDLVAEVGTGYIEPDDIWIAHWSTSSTYVPSSTSDSYVPSADWAANQRLLQYYGGHNVTYGGVKLNVDSDYLGGATAAYGSTTTFVSLAPSAPSLLVRPQPDGSVQLTPSWTGATGVSAFEILAGAAPTAMTPVQTVSASRSRPISLRDAYPYFGAAALDASGQVMDTSPPVAMPASVAIFGHSAYVGRRGPVGVPVACFGTTPCQVQVAILEGKRQLAHSGTLTIARHGGLALVPLSPQVHRLVAGAPSGRRLPVTVTVTSAGSTGASGSKASRPLNLVPYRATGKAPIRRIWSSSSVQILGKTNFVANGWSGGILAVCRTSAPCPVTTSLTLAGAPIAPPTTQTLGAGEVGYLNFRMNKKGHALLKASSGNQLGARVTVTAAPQTLTGGAAVTSVATPKTAVALVSLDSYR